MLRVEDPDDRAGVSEAGSSCGTAGVIRSGKTTSLSGSKYFQRGSGTAALIVSYHVSQVDWSERRTSVIDEGDAIFGKCSEESGTDDEKDD